MKEIEFKYTDKFFEEERGGLPLSPVGAGFRELMFFAPSMTRFEVLTPNVGKILYTFRFAHFFRGGYIKREPSWMRIQVWRRPYNHKKGIPIFEYFLQMPQHSDDGTLWWGEGVTPKGYSVYYTIKNSMMVKAMEYIIREEAKDGAKETNSETLGGLG